MYRSSILRKVREHRILHGVTLELTYRCNLDCFYCYNDREKTGRPLTLAQYELLLEDLADMQTLHLMLTGGEPMVHPHFFDIGHKARDLGFVTRIRTNGHSLNRRVSQRVKDEIAPFSVDVSLHGATAEVHDRQTRVSGSFGRLIENIQTAGELGLRVTVISTPTSWNEHQIDEMLRLCDSLGVRLRFQGPVGPRDNGDTAPLSIQPSKHAWDRIKVLQEERAKKASSDVEKMTPIVAEEESCASAPETDATCSVGVSGLDIDPFGNVQACMHLQESAGNLHDQSIKDIWDSSPLFTRARAAAVASAKRFEGVPLQQFGAPLFCLAVEENCQKGCPSGGCQSQK